MVGASAKFYVVGTPIGNLGDITLRAIEVLKSVDVIYCEDTRHSLKLLNHFSIRKPLKSCPYFKERTESEFIVDRLRAGESIAYLSDAGMPGLSDPGAILVGRVREAGLPVEVIGGVSSLTYFIAGLGVELSTFRFIGFLPAKTSQRQKWMSQPVSEPTIFFESSHRIEKTLLLFSEVQPAAQLVLAKELSKLSEAFFKGTPKDLLGTIRSWKGEWVGLWLPHDVTA